MEVASAVFFPQPLLFLVKYQLRAVAEERADSAALRVAGNGVPLARALLRVSERLSQQEPLLALWTRESPLVRRVRRIVGASEASRISRYVIPLQIAASLAAVTVLPAIAVADPALMRPVVRAVRAAAALPSDQDDTVLELLRVLRGDESPQVRYAAAQTLARVGDSRALPALAHAASTDRDANVRNAASHAVKTIKR